MAFEIMVYERENGSIPFMEFLESLSPKMKAKILRVKEYRADWLRRSEK